jgi:hypothetical protein
MYLITWLQGFSDHFQVERALKLIASGVLTIEVARASKGKASIPLPRLVNQATGKESMRQTGFNDATWGRNTRAYAQTASSLSHAKFTKIIDGAMQYIAGKGNRARSKGSDAMEVIDVEEDNIRACLELSDDD